MVGGIEIAIIIFKNIIQIMLAVFAMYVITKLTLEMIKITYKDLLVVAKEIRDGYRIGETKEHRLNTLTSSSEFRESPLSELVSSLIELESNYSISNHTDEKFRDVSNRVRNLISRLLNLNEEESFKLSLESEREIPSLNVLNKELKNCTDSQREGLRVSVHYILTELEKKVRAQEKLKLNRVHDEMRLHKETVNLDKPFKK